MTCCSGAQHENSKYGVNWKGQTLAHFPHAWHSSVSEMVIFFSVFLATPRSLPSLCEAFCMEPIGQNWHQVLELTKSARKPPTMSTIKYVLENSIPSFSKKAKDPQSLEIFISFLPKLKAKNVRNPNIIGFDFTNLGIFLLWDIGEKTLSKRLPWGQIFPHQYLPVKKPEIVSPAIINTTSRPSLGSQSPPIATKMVSIQP